MANQTTQSFGIFSGSGGGGGAAGTVTSVAMTVPSALSVAGSPITSSGTLAVTGAGSTAQYIDGTGALQTTGNVNGLVSTFNGGTNTPQTISGSSGTIDMYDPTIFPSTTFTMTQNGRASFSVGRAGVNERVGISGAATFDLISISVTVTTTCSGGGAFIAAVAGGGVMAQSFTATPALISCNGTTQTQVITCPDFRIGSNVQAPTSANTDFIQTTFVTSASGGTYGYTDITITNTQFSD
tara:strand:- start:526 stop:1245 length:720 start_codon:yes stop_codon:yes gene_type:complete